MSIKQIRTLAKLFNQVILKTKENKNTRKQSCLDKFPSEQRYIFCDGTGFSYNHKISLNYKRGKEKRPIYAHVKTELVVAGSGKGAYVVAIATGPSYSDESKGLGLANLPIAGFRCYFLAPKNCWRKKMERTLSIIKPDGVSRGLIGEVIKRFEKEGIKIAAMKMLHLTKKEAEGFYAVHKEKPFFDSLTDFMSSGPIVVMVLEGENVIQRNRDLMGATNYKEAKPGTIRADFATDIEKNVVHGSDSPENAQKEIAYFFSELEIH